MKSGARSAFGTGFILKLIRIGFLVSFAACLNQMCWAVELKPEQEALFPKDAPFDSKLWAFLNNTVGADNKRGANKEAQRRYHLVFKWGTYPGVCLAWHQNQELWGGALDKGCTKLKLNTRLPHKELFEFPDWRELDAREHVDIIKKLFIAARGSNMRFLEEQSSTPEKFRYTRDPESYWRLMGPIIKRMLEHGDVRMEEATFDVDNSGSPEHIYALTLLPWAFCREQDGSKGYDRTFLYMDSSSANAVSFNRSHLGGDPLRYRGQSYFPSDLGVSNISAKVPGSGKLGTTIWSQCEFEKAKR